MVIRFFWCLLLIIPLKALTATISTQPPAKRSSSKASPAEKPINFSAGQFQKLYVQKDYLKMSRLFVKNSKSAFFRSTPQIILMTTEALENCRLHLFAAAFKLSVIRLKYSDENRSIGALIRKKKTLDDQTYPPELLNLYFGLYRDLSNYLLSKANLKKHSRVLPNHRLVKTILQSLEYKEGEVDKLTDMVDKHLLLQEQKSFSITGSLSVKMLSWQTRSALFFATVKTDVIVTNTGICLGGDVGFENIYFQYFASGCVLIGQGTVQAEQPIIYRQSGLPVQGFLATVGGSFKVSPTGSALGVSLPVMFSNQKLTDPTASASECSDGCSVDALSPLNLGILMHGKWNFEKLYFLTEYGRFLRNDSSLLALGIGYTL